LNVSRSAICCPPINTTQVIQFKATFWRCKCQGEMSRFCPGEVIAPALAKVPTFPLPYSEGRERGRWKENKTIYT